MRFLGIVAALIALGLALIVGAAVAMEAPPSPVRWAAEACMRGRFGQGSGNRSPPCRARPTKQGVLRRQPLP